MTSEFDVARILFMSGTAALESGDLNSAEAKLVECLRLVPDRESTKHNLAILFTLRADALCDDEKFEEALVLYSRALEFDEKYPIAWSNKGLLLNEHFERIDEAISCFEQALRYTPDYVDANLNLGVAYSKQGAYSKALEYCELALKNNPTLAEGWANHGIALNYLGRHAEALVSFDQAIGLNPKLPEAHAFKSDVLHKLRRDEEALSSCTRAIELKPNFVEAWTNLGAIFNDLSRYEEALGSCNRAIEQKPNYAEAWSNRGSALSNLRRYEEAIASYEKAIELKPSAYQILGDLVRTQMKICDWTDLDGRCRSLRQGLLAGESASTPFSILGLFDDPRLQRQCAELYMQRKLKLKSSLSPIGKRGRGEKIRLAYFSADFREHPVAHLMAELIEFHDRSKFEIYGFSFGINTGDAMRRRLERSFDKFLEVRPLSDLDITRLARELKIDIAIDLGGHTQDSRPAIFAHRAAPIQINYLGYPGTMGAQNHDYFVGDRVTVSSENLEHFSEKVIYLPHCFQANPSERPRGSEESTRVTYGLPENVFVFCCFNNIWKITPDVFKTWASVLRQSEGSVLWLSVDSGPAKRRLKSTLESLDVDGDRLLFSPRVKRDIYFDQYRFADLFLDTIPYNAGTTASDALWMGTPVVTLAGRSFAGRMAASLLHSVGLPNLITHTTKEYESLAIELANNPKKITSLKAKLAENRPTCPLFNTALSTRHIESGYKDAYERFHDGLPRDHIYVDP